MYRSVYFADARQHRRHIPKRLSLGCRPDNVRALRKGWHGLHEALKISHIFSCLTNNYIIFVYSYIVEMLLNVGAITIALFTFTFCPLSDWWLQNHVMGPKKKARSIRATLFPSRMMSNIGKENMVKYFHTTGPLCKSFYL